MKREERCKYNRKTLVWEVCNEALNSSDIKCFFTDLLNNGCACGMIGGLIYYRDTERFFDKYYDKIEELRQETEENTGMPLRIEGFLKNWLAWFGFEETAYRLVNELGLEV